MVTRRPRALSSRPRLEAVRPLPRLDATPPVTKRCLVDDARDENDAAGKGKLPWSVRSGEAAGPRAIRISAGHHHASQQRGPPRAKGAAVLPGLSERGNYDAVCGLGLRSADCLTRRCAAVRPCSSVSPNRASATAQTTARLNPRSATPPSPGRVWSPRNITPTTAGGTVSASTTAAVATVTLPASSAVAYSMNETIPAAASA